MTSGHAAERVSYFPHFSEFYLTKLFCKASTHPMGDLTKLFCKASTHPMVDVSIFEFIVLQDHTTDAKPRAPSESLNFDPSPRDSVEMNVPVCAFLARSVVVMHRYLYEIDLSKDWVFVQD
jgi:hypothetical protein